MDKNNPGMDKNCQGIDTYHPGLSEMPKVLSNPGMDKNHPGLSEMPKVLSNPGIDKNHPGGVSGQNEMPKLLADWLLSGKSYDTDTDTDTETQSDVECPFDVRVVAPL